jgi:hypothetical protein
MDGRADGRKDGQKEGMKERNILSSTDAFVLHYSH